MSRILTIVMIWNFVWNVARYWTSCTSFVFRNCLERVSGGCVILAHVIIMYRALVECLLTRASVLDVPRRKWKPWCLLNWSPGYLSTCQWPPSLICWSLRSINVSILRLRPRRGGAFWNERRPSVSRVPRHNSRTERPRKTKFGRVESHHMGNPWTYLEVKRSKVKVTRSINAYTVNAQYLPNGKA